MSRLSISVLVALLLPTVAAAEPGLVDESLNTLRAFVGLGYQGTPGGNGGVVTGGLRYGLGRHLALSLDASYGMVSSKQDRWSVMPSIALVIPTDRLRFDLGAGIGPGTSSGFATWDDFAHDRTAWANEAVPTVRSHAIAAFTLTPRFELFARVDVSGQLLEGNTLGWRHGDGPAHNADVMWINLSLGGQFRLL